MGVNGRTGLPGQQEQGVKSKASNAEGGASVLMDLLLKKIDVVVEKIKRKKKFKTNVPMHMEIKRKVKRKNSKAMEKKRKCQSHMAKKEVEPKPYEEKEE